MIIAGVFSRAGSINLSLRNLPNLFVIDPMQCWTEIETLDNCDVSKSVRGTLDAFRSVSIGQGLVFTCLLLALEASRAPSFSRRTRGQHIRPNYVCYMYWNTIPKELSFLSIIDVI